MKFFVKTFLIMAILVVAILCFPGLNEIANPCNALEKIAVRERIDEFIANETETDKERDAQLLAMAITNGRLAAKTAEKTSPKIMPTLTCAVKYYDILLSKLLEK